MAMIKPYENSRILSIPHCAAILKKDGTLSGKFKVFPEQTLLICTLCSALGNREALCPTTIAGVQAAEQDTPKEPQNTEPTVTQTNALVALAWDTMAEYEVVKPIKLRQKKAHAKAQTQPQSQPIVLSEYAHAEAPQTTQMHVQGTQSLNALEMNEPIENLAKMEQEPLENLAQVSLSCHPIVAAQENTLHAQHQDSVNWDQAASAQEGGRPRHKAQYKLTAVTNPSPYIINHIINAILIWPSNSDMCKDLVGFAFDFWEFLTFHK
ncbi:hypothetical protein DSO57_1000479 [Entomophthora muscae]|uniref:Uncharacterized protein n=1 Tax=Entomophthora muscae TaxID=34485 RepID=A0ACC2UV77_9FUNG|nr:hypothetical protein DSO57_1000479 [Entomophthora muscae]